jgi:hypothetical protein
LRAVRSHTNANAHSHANADVHTNTYSNCITYAYSNTNPYTYADAVHREVWTDTEAVPEFGWATHSASSFNTATCRFAECDPSAAAVKIQYSPV